MDISRTNKMGVTGPMTRRRAGGLLVSETIVAVAFLLLLVENALQSQVSDAFSYLDEAVCLLFCLAAGIKQISKRRAEALTPEEVIMAVLAFALCCLGLAGNIVHEVQPSNFAIAVDLFTCNKFVLTYIACSIVLDEHNYKSIAALCMIISKLFIAVAFVCMVANQLFKIGMSWEQRFGIEAFVFTFGHPSNFSAAVAGIFALLLTNLQKNKLSLACCIVLLASSLRFKAIAFVAVILLAIFAFRKLSRITFGFVFVAVIVAAAAASYQLDIYLTGDTARGFLLTSSFDVANATFPLGTGFGTYGSDVTKEAYTSLYTMLGFQNVYGLTASNPIYLADMFYSTVIAQCGWIGLVLFCSILLCLIADVTKIARANHVFFWAAMSLPIYLLISSTSESSFFSSYCVYLALCLVIILRTSAHDASHSTKS